ncbi:MAG: ATP-binding protein [Janthinobacterium lividum]
MAEKPLRTATRPGWNPGHSLTLSQRLSLAFSILLLACCGASAWLQIVAIDMREKEVVQGLSRSLATTIARDTELMDATGLKPDAARRLFDQLMVVNPSVEVYLLDVGGKIIGHAAPAGRIKRDHVDLAPLRRFLAGAMLPILGDDPRDVARKKVFSAAPLQTGGKTIAYVYVVLQGEAHDRLAKDVAASGVLRTTLWSMAVVALLGLLAGWIAFRSITHPLRRLTDTMRGFDTEAEPVVPPVVAGHSESSSVRTRDEIAVLEMAFGQMATRIAEQWQSLSRLDLERRELVANISHDLRTPMASLHGYLETLLRKDAVLAPGERQRYLGVALAQSSKVGKLAQALFDLARLEHGLVAPELEDFSLTDLVQDVFQKFELQAAARQVRLLAELPPLAAIVSADLGMIERVLTNLLDNALRHTPANGWVRVAVVNLPHTVEVTLSDNGPGIPAAMHERLFRRPLALKQAQRGKERQAMPAGNQEENRQGGLGLLIVHRILQLHGRDIRLLAVPGQGATFRFELALARRAGLLAQPRDSAQ